MKKGIKPENGPGSLVGRAKRTAKTQENESENETTELYLIT
jgi:hypothetical protein